MNTSCYLINLGPHTCIKCQIPNDVWSDRSADYFILIVFDCMVYYHVDERKLEPRTKKGLFMGYEDGVNGYGVWSPSEKRVVMNMNVVFDESYMLKVSAEPIS